MKALLLTAHLAVLLTLPILLVGVIQRTKARWAGRKGPSLLQFFFDLRRLLQKEPVFTTAAVGLVQWAPLVVLATSLVAGLFVPLVGPAPLSFDNDFIAFAYFLGLGRVAIMLAGMDTGSAFEGMGVAREATFSALAEPIFFLVMGTAGLATDHGAIGVMLASVRTLPAAPVVLVGCAVVLFVLLQVEAARIPVDDPSTHLELTMIHEVMILDHSGSELASLEYAAAVKMTALAGLLAGLVNPFDASRSPGLFAVCTVGLILAVGVGVGCVESWVARLRMRAVPRYIVAAVIVSAATLLVALQGSSA